MESVYLSGSEEVRRAGSSISSAADQMRSAAGAMQEIERPIQAFGEFVQRLENAIACLGEIEAMKAENKHREQCGNSVAYGDEAFFLTLQRFGMRQS
jgi:hypothetical protein